MPAELRTALWIGITDDRTERLYRLKRIDADAGKLAWELSYSDSDGETVYQVHQDQTGKASCDCKGYRMHQQECRHIRGLSAERLLKKPKGEN